MERTILVLRHGKSVHGPEYPCDFDRPLAPRGIKSAAVIGNLLVKQGIIPELVISSAAERAISTARIVCDEAGGIELQEDEQLYFADVASCYELIHGLDDSLSAVMLVGHNPTLEMFVDSLTDREDTELKTCSLAIVRCKCDSWRELIPENCDLDALYHPRDLM